MKLITIQVDEEAGTSSFPKGTEVMVTAGEFALEGRVFAHTDLLEPEPALVPHTHIIEGVASSARVTGQSGPALPG